MTDDSRRFAPLELIDEAACTGFAQSVVDAYVSELLRVGGFLVERNSGIGHVESIVSATFMPWFGQNPSDRFVDIFDQVSFFAEHLACNHIFTDGNKRTAVRISLSLVTLKGFKIDIDDSADPRQNDLKMIFISGLSDS